ncbi:MAG: hypothetical protein ACRDIA_08110, partial [Actinomycetota bacterium]
VEEHDGWVWLASAPNPPPEAYDPEAELPPAGRAIAPESDTGKKPGAAPPAQTIEHPQESIDVEAGAELEIGLPTNPRPGHVWLFDVSPSCVTILTQYFDDQENVHHLRIGATEPGEVILGCSYSRPWDRDFKERRTYRIRIRSPKRALPRPLSPTDL